MQIIFNTDDSVDDLSKIHEILIEAIKKKGGSVNLQQIPIQNQQNVQQTVQKPVSFSDTLKQDMALSMGFNVQKPIIMPQPAQAQPKSYVQAVNEEYKRQYEENKDNPNKPKSQNPEIDMGNIYYSEKRRKI